MAAESGAYHLPGPCPECGTFCWYAFCHEPQDDDLRWFNEVYRQRFPNDTVMIADLDQQLARFKEEPPPDDPDTL